MFDPEDKITYDELAPSLRKKIASIDETMINSLIDNKITNAINTSISTLINTTINNIGTSDDSLLKKYIDGSDFLNLPPKVGFFDEKQLPIFATYNMSYSPTDFAPAYCITDSVGQEVQYFMASDGYASIKLYKCSRLNDLDAFTFYNNSVMTPLCVDGAHISMCLGLGNDYIVVYIVNYPTGSGSWVIYKTEGSSDSSKWTEFINISPIFTNSMFSIEYNSEYDTIIAYVRDDSKMTYTVNIYKASDLSLIISRQLVDMRTMIHSTAPDVQLTSMAFSRKHGCCYNKNTEQLIIMGEFVVYPIVNGKPSYLYLKFIHSIDIPKTFFAAGVGGISSATPREAYDYYGGPAYAVEGSWCGFTLTYDEYEQCVRFGEKGENTPYFIIRISSDIRAIDLRYRDANQARFTVPLPDANPWAKSIGRPLFAMGGLLYFTASSTSYGTNVICAELESGITADRTIKVAPGKWWLSAKEETDNPSRDSRNITCIYDGTSVSYYYCAEGVNIRRLSLSDFIDSGGQSRKGKRSSTDIGILAPMLPTGITGMGVCGYDPIRGKIHYIAKDTISPDPTKQNFPFCVTYDISTKLFTERRDVPPIMVDLAIQSRDSFKTPAVIQVYSNIFIDTDGAAYFSIINGYVAGNRISNVLKLTDTTFTETLLVIGLYYGEPVIGYDEVFGYYSSRPTGYMHGILISSKDRAGGPSKTSEAFFNGDVYYNVLRLAASSGLVAYMQGTAIFLGGYLSNIPQQEITLMPNCDNYIYLIRNRADRSKIDIVVRDKPIGVLGENGFNRVLAAKATTDSGKVISQITYDI